MQIEDLKFVCNLSLCDLKETVPVLETVVRDFGNFF